MAERRFIVRDNARKRLAPLDGTPGRAVYADGEARLELEEETLIVRPPFGLNQSGDYDVVRVGPLLDAIAEDHLVGVLLVRLGGFAVGVFDGEELVASKVGTRNVHGRHRAGGSSANRFRRRREGQARVLVEAAAETGVRVLDAVPRAAAGRRARRRPDGRAAGAGGEPPSSPSSSRPRRRAS